MKKFLRIIFLVFLTVATFFVWDFFLVKNKARIENNFFKVERPCGKPLEFSVGEVDPKFEISKDELVVLAQEAEKFWDDSSGRNVFVYNPEANFKINLIFDERQEQTVEAEKLEADLKDIEFSRGNLLKEHELLSESYEKKMAEYEKAFSKYEKKLKEYNKDVEYWNKKGGAPEDEYEKLEEEKEELEDDYKKLEKQRKIINDLAKKTNNLAVQDKKLVNNYNNELKTFKSEFGEAREFEKGIFAGDVINIYQFQEKTDLKLTIIHELGHYLGLGHTENPKSIMYYLMGDQDLENPILTDEDKTELKRICEM